jgi:hypothetical protein
LSHIITSEKFSIKEASSILRNAMLKSHDVIEYLDKNPDSSVQKAFLHSSMPKVEDSRREPWLKRIAKESVIKTQNEK